MTRELIPVGPCGWMKARLTRCGAAISRPHLALPSIALDLDATVCRFLAGG